MTASLPKAISAAAISAAPNAKTPVGNLCSQFLLGATLACIAAIAAGGWLGSRFSAERLAEQRTASATAIVRTAATSLEVLLTNGDLTAARRVVAELSSVPGITEASLTLPDGKIVADSVARNIELRSLPTSWREPTDAGRIANESAAGDGAFLLEAIDLPKRGTLFLRVTLARGEATFGVAEYSVFALIGVVALLLMLLANRRLRSRMAGISVVGDALRSLAAGEETLDQLKLAEALGPEAAHWNRVIDRFDVIERNGKAAAARSTLGEAAVDRRAQSNGGESSGDLHSAIDLLPTGILLVNDNFAVRVANGAGAALLHTSRDAINGVDVRTLLAGAEFAEVMESTLRVGHGCERRTLEVDRGTAGGGVVRVNVRPLRREDQGGALVTLEDVTQQRIADAARNQFVAQATHELRAPLTNMRLCLESALDDDANDLDAVTRHLNVLNDETRRLERLVSEMLSVAEIEAGSLSLRADDVKLDRLFEELRADYSKSCAEKTQQLHFELPPKFPQLHGDRDKLAAALHNILGNSVKYTPAGGKITVTAKQAGDRFVIDLTDTGFGIPADDQPRIFERFFRARDPRISKITGTGLGLALSREVARLHGGELTFKSEFNRGTTFTLSLPVSLQPA